MWVCDILNLRACGRNSGLREWAFHLRLEWVRVIHVYDSSSSEWMGRVIKVEAWLHALYLSYLLCLPV